MLDSITEKLLEMAAQKKPGKMANMKLNAQYTAAAWRARTSIAEKIRRGREAMGLSQTQLAVRIGVLPTVVHQAENRRGKVEHLRTILLAIAENQPAAQTT
jgi:ribosome-binding protein aMBF1 (putative translation factor)